VIKLKEIVNIRYKSIIAHDDEKVSDQVEVEATHEFTLLKESYQFIHPNYGKMLVALDGNDVILKHNTASMRLTYLQKKKILYKVMYGEVELIAELKKMNRTNDSIHLVYYLYDNTTLLSKCYLMIDKINPILS